MNADQPDTSHPLAPRGLSIGPLGLLDSFGVNAVTSDKLTYIADFDFSAINQTIVDKFDEVAIEIGDAWLNQHSPMKPVQVKKFIGLIERETKRFLSIRLLYPDYRGKIVPTRLVDRMWHQFIVDTREYVRFCDDVYGEYLHHEPARRSSETIAEYAGQAFAETKALLIGAYGALPRVVWGFSAGCNYQACMSGCFD